MSRINAYTEAVKKFMSGDPAKMAKNAGATYDPAEAKITLKYLGTEVEIEVPTAAIKVAAPWEPVVNDRVLILQYLSSACRIPPQENWVSFLQLPGGQHHHNPFVSEAITPLAEEFGSRVGEFKKRVADLGAREIKMGDFGAVIPAFPHLPLAVCLWQGDDELAARANILFDLTAPLHLSTAALWVLGVEVSRKIRGVVGQQYS